MFGQKAIRCPRLLRSSGRIAALAVALLTTSPARSEIIKVDDMLRGIAITQPQCDAIEHTVWVQVHGREFCVRYYLSTAGGDGRRPIVFLQGDKFGRLDLKTWTWSDLGKTEDVNTQNLQTMADAFSKRAKTTAIYLARIGVDGTSGNHTARKTVLELHLVNAALNAIKQRHGFEGFHLAGQSGGSKLVGGLIVIRNDIGCAVAGAGPLAQKKNASSGDPARSFFDPSEHIAEIVHKRWMRLIVVTDPQDRTVAVDLQSSYVAKLRQAGGQVEQYFVSGTDEKHHGVVDFTNFAVAGCVLGRSSADIARALGVVTARNNDWNAMRAAEANIGGRTIQRAAGQEFRPMPPRLQPLPSRPGSQS